MLAEKVITNNAAAVKLIFILYISFSVLYVHPYYTYIYSNGSNTNFTKKVIKQTICVNVDITHIL